MKKRIKEMNGSFYFTAGEVIAVKRDYLVLDEMDERSGGRYLETYWLNDGTCLKNIPEVRTLRIGQQVEIGYVPISKDNIAVSVETAG